MTSRAGRAGGAGFVLDQFRDFLAGGGARPRGGPLCAACGFAVVFMAAEFDFNCHVGAFGGCRRIGQFPQCHASALFRGARKPRNYRGPSRLGAPGRNRTAERKQGKNILLGNCWGRKSFAYFLPIFCTNSRHLQTVQGNSRRSQVCGRKEVRLKSANVSKTGQIEVKRMNFGC